MKSLKYLLFGVVMCGISTVNGQGVNLRLDSNSLDALPFLVHLNSTYTVIVVIHNDSVTPFVGTINIAGMVNSTLVTGSDTPTAIFYYPTDTSTETIPAHDTIDRELIISVTTPPFIIGSSGVVIWPIVNLNPNHLAITISDSISKTITVQYAVGINELNERKLKVFMSGEQLVIQNNGEYLLKNVDLFDVTGNLIREQSMTVSGTINMDDYASGVYLAQITFTDNTRAVVKVVNAR